MGFWRGFEYVVRTGPSSPPEAQAVREADYALRFPRMLAVATKVARVQPSEKPRNRAIERESNRDDLAGGGIPLPPLNPPNVIPVGLASAGESFLR